MLAEKDAEILKLKESLRYLRKQGKSPEKVKPDVNVTAGTAASSSAASLFGDEKVAIVQLEQKIGELTEVINLHRLAEQDMSKKLRHFEMSRTKEDVNCEYVRNIFLKYLIFSENGAESDAKRLEKLLLELLHINRQEKEALEKSRANKSSFWNIFASNDVSFAELNTSSYVLPAKLQRAQTEAILEIKKKADTEASAELCSARAPGAEFFPSVINKTLTKK